MPGWAARAWRRAPAPPPSRRRCVPGAAIGLDPEEQAERIALGGTRNAGLAQDWIERDTGAVLRARGLDPARATLGQKREAWAALDAFNDRVTEAAMGLTADRGLGAEAGAGAGVVELVAPVPEPRGSDATADVPDALPTPPTDRSEAPSWLAGLASRLRSGDHSDRAEHGYRYALEYELRQEIGSDGLLALQKGRAEVLAPALPDPADRLAVARAYVEVLAAERSDPELTRTAGDPAHRRGRAGVEDQVPHPVGRARPQPRPRRRPGPLRWTARRPLPGRRFRSASSSAPRPGRSSPPSG